MTVRVRFAPSPTGTLHIGTLRAALFNWLYCRAQKGVFILRIEDTDRERSKPEFETNILEGLRWFGLAVDEGPVEGGNFGPYRQSERIEAGIYQDLAQKLLDDGKAYHCFMTAEEIGAEKEAAQAAGKPYMHTRKELSKEEVNEKIEAGTPYVIRFKMTEEKEIKYTDMVRGTVSFDCALISDFVIMKSDGTPSYNFAVVVDDALMKITHVVRGEDHVSNVPRQLAVYEALGFEAPQFAHLPLILGPDKAKLSKRHGATSVTEYRDQGYVKEALFNYLALLGWSPKSEQEIFSIEELVAAFDIQGVNKSAAVFDVKKLGWMNGQYMREYGVSDFLELILPYMNSVYKEALQALSEEKQKVAVGAVQDNLTVLADINDYIDVFLESEEEALTQIKALEIPENEQAVVAAFIERLNNDADIETAEQYDACLNALLEQLQCGKGKVLKPVRKALTGRQSGPNIAELLAFFGRGRVLARLSHSSGL